MSQEVIFNVDFLPQVVGERGKILFGSLPAYEPFAILCQRANEWLATYVGHRVISCESVEVKGNDADPRNIDNVSGYYMEGRIRNDYIRYLRLWVEYRSDYVNYGPHKIGYLNFVPAIVKQGGIFSRPEFTPFNGVIDSVNQYIAQNPIQGRILNLETQDIKVGSWSGSCDPEKTVWSVIGERRNSNHHQTKLFLWTVRLFFEIGEPMHESVGTVDVVPALTDMGGFMKLPKSETYVSSAQKANAWISSQSGSRITNVQTLEYKMESTWGGGVIDTNRTFYYQSGRLGTMFLRIIRVCFTRSPHVSTPPELFGYRSFQPGITKIPSMFGQPQYELQTSSLARLQAWTKYAGAKIVNIETEVMRSYAHLGQLDPENTIAYDSQAVDVLIFVYRVYFSGPITEPPSEVIPPMPVPIIEESGCCSVS